MTTADRNHFSVESYEVIPERPHPRAIAAERVADYRARQGTQYLTQAAIDGKNKVRSVDWTRRAVRGHHASLFRKLWNLIF